MAGEGRNNLDKAERLRERVAERMRVPVGYLGLFGIGVAGLTVGVVLRSRPALEDVGLWLALIGVLLAGLMPVLVRRRRGVGVPEGRGLRYRSGRRNTVVFLALSMPPFVAAVLLAYATTGLFWLALACGILTGIGAGIGLGLMYRNMIEDLRRGTVKPA